jgi:flagellin-like protein
MDSCSRKGVSPLIAAVLLIAFTMAIAGLAGPFFTDLIQGIQTDTEKKSGGIIDASNSRVEIKRVDYNGENVSGTIQNTGEGEISNFTVTVQGNNPKQIQIDEKLSTNEIKNFEVSDVEDPETVRVDSRNKPVSDQKRIKESNPGSQDNPQNTNSILTVGGNITALKMLETLVLGTNGEKACLGPKCSDIQGSGSGEPVKISGDDMTGTLTSKDKVTDIQCIVSDGLQGGACTEATTSDTGTLTEQENTMYGYLSMPTMETQDENTCIGDLC